MQFRLAIVTATFNSIDTIPALAASIISQTCSDFEWIVADGGSTDGTQAYLESLEFENLRITSAPDFGIYDALNRALKKTNADYYLVVGSDDLLSKDAVEVIFSSLKEGDDIVTFQVLADGNILAPIHNRRWLAGMRSDISAHSVGTVFRRALHKECGYYSRKFPIAADQLFVGSAIKSGARLRFVKKTIGTFGTDGVSSQDYLGVSTEFCRVQIELGYSRFEQVALLCVRALYFALFKKKIFR